MKPGYIVIIALGALCCSASAQDFTVMSLKGKVEYRSSPGQKNSGWMPVRIGDRFKEQDELKTSFASYVKLLHKGGRLLSVDENSTRKLGDLLPAKSGRGAGGATASILNYAAQQMQTTKTRQDRQDVFGAVRAELDLFTPALPSEAVLSATPSFRWVDTDTSNSYTLFIYDQQLNVRYEGALTGRKSSWPQDLDSGKTGGLYYWRLRRASDGAVTPPRRFRVLPSDSVRFLAGELNRLDAELAGMHADELMRHLIRAIYLEKQGLYTDAFEDYRECVRMSPDTEEYREMASRMLEELQLLEESRYLLENQ